MPLEQTIDRLSADLRQLGPGPLADLRRMDPTGPGTTAFWSLAARCGFLEEATDAWMRIVKIMAILTPRGEPDRRPPLHNARRPLGAVLCDGGRRDWADGAGVQPRPFVSEMRLARFLSQPPGQRPQALERLARMLATQRDPTSGVNCIDIAALLLNPDNRTALRALARTYYQRLNSATHRANKEGTTA